VAAGPVVIRTLLGSCISACLYDPVRRVVGMNHFLLGNRRYARDLRVTLSEAGRYGIHAMELVINGMLALGARRENLRAKAFGGGAVLESGDRADNFFCVGDVNRRFVLEFLKNEDIPLVASDLGGDSGRVIYFSSEDYSVHVRRIGGRARRQLARRDHRFWQEKIRAQEQLAAEPELW
jgi:chemotaxis protein CheD